MAHRAILSRKEQLDRELASYRGDDPFKLRYDFLLWLDSNFGKDKVKDIFISTLEETLHVHWNDRKYRADPRLIELQMIYARVQADPPSVFQGYYDRGVARESASLYIHWANYFESLKNYAEADRVFKLGSEKISSSMKTELHNAFENFLAKVGRKFLDGELSSEKENNDVELCPKCRTQQASSPKSSSEDDIILEMNPGKAGCWDDFQTVVAYFDSPDPKVIRMYPKDKVYKDAGKEYSLEEIRAAEYFEKCKRRKLELQNMQEISSKPQLNFNTSLPKEEDGNKKGSVFPTPLLQLSGKEESICTQSFTSRTKMAINLVQDMWSSPTPETQAPVFPKNDLERDKGKTRFSLFNHENSETSKATEKKTPNPSALVFTDSTYANDENVDNVAMSGKRVAAGSAEEGFLFKSKVLSERKVGASKIPEEGRPMSKQQLQFGGESKASELACELSETSISSHPVPFQPFGDIKPLYPVEPSKDDCSDFTCNTKAFNFELPSSTPVQQKKSMAPLHSDRHARSLHNDEPSYHTEQRLSVILEGSKERCSSSDVAKQLVVEDFHDIDPFCPLLNDKLLSLLNFPQPHHHENYAVMNGNLPTITKQIRLGNETFATFGDLGKGAYARVVKASCGKTTVAMKIEKPACKWEYYIAKEIQKRVDCNVKSLFMDIKGAYIFFNGSILLTEWAKYGSLLNVINQYKIHLGKVLDQVLSLYMSIEIVKAVEFLHKCKIIHGDIKPDNFVVRNVPSIRESDSCLMLIDYGRSIDMTLFPEGTKFDRVVTTEGFQCNEMKDKRPWNYQIDLYGIAGTIHCLLVGDYMKVVKKNDEWRLQKLLPRNMRRDLWDPIFHKLLNVQSCDQLPDLTSIRETLEIAYEDFSHTVRQQYFNYLANVLTGK